MISMLFMYHAPFTAFVLRPCLLSLHGTEHVCSPLLPYVIHATTVLQLIAAARFKNVFPANWLLLLSFSISAAYSIGIVSGQGRIDGCACACENPIY